jgi:hypothetical protein
MKATTSDSGILHRLEGAVQRVDPSARELLLLVDGIPINLVVPPDCVICLNGERVKLRLLQPGDRVEATYSFENGTPFAQSVQAHWLLRAFSRGSGKGGECPPVRPAPSGRASPIPGSEPHR